GLLPDGPGERTETRLAVAGATRLVRHPLRGLRVALVSWSVALGALLVGSVSVTLAWAAIRPGLQALVVSSDPVRLAGAPPPGGGAVGRGGGGRRALACA